jgi:hypothetical protein
MPLKKSSHIESTYPGDKHKKPAYEFSRKQISSHKHVKFVLLRSEAF